MEHVATGTCIRMATESRQQLLARLCSMMGSRAVAATRLSAMPPRSLSGVWRAPPSRSQQPTFALQTMTSPATMVAGAIPQGLISTCHSLHLRPLPSTGPESFLSYTEGNYDMNIVMWSWRRFFWITTKASSIFPFFCSEMWNNHISWHAIHS